MRKKIYILVPTLLVFVGILSAFIIKGSDQGGSGAISDETPVSDWNWQNPYTFKDVPIPGEWQIATGDQFEDTLLALSHNTGRSLVYLVYEVTLDPMSLEDYVEAMQASNREELGTEEFKVYRDEHGQEFYVAGGAKYFGDNLVVSKVHIWSNKADHFWRSVTMTNIEYREVEYDADHLAELLIDSTM